MMNKLRLIGMVFVLAAVVLDPVRGPAAPSSNALVKRVASPGGRDLRVEKPPPLTRRDGPTHRYGLLIGRAGSDPDRFWNYIRRASRLEPQLFEAEGKKKRSPQQTRSDPQ